MKLLLSIFALLASLALLDQAVMAGSDPRAELAPQDGVLGGGVWHFKSVSCVDTAVVLVEPRLIQPGQTKFARSDFAAGVFIVFDTHLGLAPAFPNERATIATYSLASNDVMLAEHAGDKVQVCLLGVQLPSFSPNGSLDCNPDKDSRGRAYRVYDYLRHKAYWGWNSTHLCGGA